MNTITLTWQQTRQLAGAVLMALAAFLAAGGAPARAQNLFDPVARVEDAVVTGYELSQRAAFLTLLGSPGDAQSVALEQLVNERLQRAAAEQAGIVVDADALRAGMEEFAARANLDAEAFIKALAQGGVAAETFRDFVRAGLMWREVVRARFARQVDISDAEVDRAIAALQPGAGVRVLLSEIVLPANTPAAQRASTQRAAQIAKITTLPAFASAARRYSAAPSRGRSGRLDWIDIATLPAQVAAAVLPLAPGQVTDPIPVRNAIALFQMRAIEETEASGAPDLSTEYAMYYIAGGHSPAAMTRAAKVADEVDTCDDLYGVAQGEPEEALAREVKTVAEMPADIALELAKLDPGEVSTALTRNSGQTLMFLMLCGRTPVLPEEVSRDQVLTRLQNKRLNDLAIGYLQELKADAHIEILIGG